MKTLRLLLTGLLLSPLVVPALNGEEGTPNPNPTVEGCCECYKVTVSDNNDPATQDDTGQLSTKTSSNGTVDIVVRIEKLLGHPPVDGEPCNDAPLTFKITGVGGKVVAEGAFDQGGANPQTFPFSLDPLDGEDGKFEFESICPYGTGSSETSEGYENGCKKVDIYFEGCSACKTCAGGGGEGDGSGGGGTSLGGGDNGDSEASLNYHNEEESVTNQGPSALRVSGSGVTVTKDANGDLATAQTDTVKATVTKTPTAADPKAFEVDLEFLAGSATGTNFRTMRVENVPKNTLDGNLVSLKFTYTDHIHDKVDVTEYTRPNAQTLVMYSGNGLRRTTKTTSESEDGSSRSESVVVDEYVGGDPGWVFSTISARVSSVERDFAYLPGRERLTREVIDPSGEALTTIWEYYGMGEVTDGAAGGGSMVGTGRLKRMVRYDGYEETHTYSANKHTVNASFAGDSQGITTVHSYNPAGDAMTVTRSVGNALISKTIRWRSGTNEVTVREYTDNTAYLDTVTEYYSKGADFGRQVKRVTRPDGTVTIHSHSRAGGSKITETYKGVPDGAIISEGTKTVRTLDEFGQVESEITTAEGTGAGTVLSHQVVIGSDAYGRALSTGYFPDGTGYAYTTSTVYNCCGVESETDRYGITTYYAYDDLRRIVKTNRLGVTEQTVYSGRSTTTHRYPESSETAVLPGGSAAAANKISASETNLAGTVTESWTPDPSSATAGDLVKTTSSTTYLNPESESPAILPAGIGYVTVVEPPMAAGETIPPKQTKEYHPDGNTYQSGGDLSPGMRYGYSVNATGLVTTQSYVDDGILRETTAKQTDRAGRTVRITYMDGAFATMEYNALGQMDKSTDPDGVVTLMEYNAEGEQTVTAIDMPVDENTPRNGAIDYGTDTVQSSVTNPATATINGVSGPVWKTVSKVWYKDENNQVVEATVSTALRSADGLSSSTESIGVANPSTSLTTLSGGGNWNSVTTSPDTTTTTDTYVAGLREVSENKDSNGAVVVSINYGYDSLNRPYEQLDSRLVPSTVPTEVPEFSYAHTTTTYLSATADVVKSITVPRVGSTAARATYFTYDVRGRRITVDAPDTDVIDTEGITTNSLNVTTTAYKPDGTVQETSGAQTYRTTHTYDYAQRMVGMTTYGTETATTTWKYSPERGFLTEKINPGEINNGTASADYSYTNAGRLLTRTWERGVTTTYGYDCGGRQTSIDYSDTTPDVSITYDALNRPDEVTSGTSTWDYEYDATLRLLSETHPLGGTSTERVLTRSYDSLSRHDGFDLGTPADPDLDHSASYGFDDAGRYGNVTGAGKSFGYTYTAGDLIDTVTGPAHTVTNIWDKPRRTIYSKNNEVDSVTVSQYTYGVNHIGQRETVQTTGTAFGNTNRGWAWGYDSLGQATKAVNAADTALNRAYGFDGIGNRTSATDGSGGAATTVGYTPNALNQYEAINPGTEVNPTYDADGNLRNDAGINALTYGLKYDWDAENRLIAVRKADDTLIATYAYDYMSRRIRKTTTAAAHTVGATDTAYLYDGWNVVAEYSISGGSTVALVQAYTWGLDLNGSMQGAGGVGGLLSIHRGPGTDGNGDRTWTDTFYPTYDGNGNVSEYLDKDGDEAAHFEYDPFGRLAASTGTPAAFTYRFSTKPQDFETGLYYYGYRFYDPVTGRWPSRDPIEERGGVNLYGFVRNRVANQVDHLGLVTILPQVAQAVNGGRKPLFDNSSFLNTHPLLAPFQGEHQAVKYGFAWLFGIAPARTSFNHNSEMVNDILNHEAINKARNIIVKDLWDKHQAQSGNGIPDYDISKRIPNHGLDGVEGVLKYLRDYSIVITGNAFGGNLTATFLGSYAIRPVIISNVDTKKCTAEVYFSLINMVGIESGSRFPIIGYEDEVFGIPTATIQSNVTTTLNNLLAGATLGLVGDLTTDGLGIPNGLLNNGAFGNIGQNAEQRLHWGEEIQYGH